MATPAHDSIPPELRPSPLYSGFIDGFDAANVNGWAVTRAGDPCEVTLLVNGMHFATVRAEHPRPDLAAQGLSGGLGGWRADLRPVIVPGDNRVEVRLPDGTFLHGSPFVIVGGEKASAGPAPAFRGEIDVPIGTVIRGWAATGTGDECEVLVRVNDGDPIALRADRDRPDLLAQGLSKGKGGWRHDVAALLVRGTNTIRVTFPDGRDLPNSPFERVWGEEAAAQASALGRSFLGAIDSAADADVLSGWATHASGGECSLRVHVNDQLPFTVDATGPRPDLAAQGLSSGNGGWRVEVGPLLVPGRNIVRLVFPDGTDVPGSPIVRFIEGPERTGPITYRGAIDTLDGEVLAGWAVTDEGDECEVTLRVNDGPSVRVTASLPRPDLIAQRLARRSGGWSAPIGALLRPGENRIEALFPDGTALPGSPLAIQRPQPSAIPAQQPVPATEPEAEPQPEKAELPSLAELDDLSLDDISLAVAAGLIELPKAAAPAEPEGEPAEAPPEIVTMAAEAPAPAAPPPAPRRGFLARLFGG